MKALLIRHDENKIDGETVQTLGILKVLDDNDEVVKAFTTLELPWLNNKNMVSCIPPAKGGKESYKMELLDSSPSFEYEHYWIKDVPNRSYIKIHRGNYYTQIEGCILIGKSFKDINEDGIVDVKDSTQALKELVSLLGKEAEITIFNPL